MGHRSSSHPWQPYLAQDCMTPEGRSKRAVSSHWCHDVLLCGSCSTHAKSHVSGQSCAATLEGQSRLGTMHCFANSCKEVTTNLITFIALRKSWSLKDLWPLTSHLSHRVKLSWSLITVVTGAAGSEKMTEGRARLRKQFLSFSLGRPITTLTSSTLT